MPAMLSQRVLPLTVRPKPGHQHDDEQREGDERPATMPTRSQSCGRRLHHQPGAGEPDGHGAELPPEEIERPAVVALGQRHGRRRHHDQADPEQRADGQHQHEVEVLPGVRAAVDARARSTPAFTRPSPHGVGEHLAAVLVAREHVEAAAGGRQQHGAARAARASRAARHGLRQRVGQLARCRRRRSRARSARDPGRSGSPAHRGRAAPRPARRTPGPCRHRRRSAPADRARRGCW